MTYVFAIMIPSFPFTYLPFSFTWLPISHSYYKGHSAAALDLLALELAANKVPALPSWSVKLGRASVRPCQHGEQECWRGVIINNTSPIPTLSASPPTIAPPLTLPLMMLSMSDSEVPKHEKLKFKKWIFCLWKYEAQSGRLLQWITYQCI